MPNLNRVFLIGHLGADPETKPAGETTATKFNLAVTDTWKDSKGDKQQHTNWVPITCWNGRGEQVKPYLKKGSCVLVEGSIRVSKYDDAGTPRYFTEVIATNIVFLDRKPAEKAERKKKT